MGLICAGGPHGVAGHRLDLVDAASEVHWILVAAPSSSRRCAFFVERRERYQVTRYTVSINVLLPNVERCGGGGSWGKVG
jgi:esterase/lipase superfamily enzyme